MTNRDKIEMLRKMHEAINDQLCDVIDSGYDVSSLENMQLYTIGIGGKTFSFPATIIYRVMFDGLFSAFDNLKNDTLAGIETAPSMLDGMEAISKDFDDMLKRIQDLDDNLTETI